MTSTATNSARFVRAANIQTRVLYALMLRETKTRYGRLKVGYLWALIEPSLYVSVFFILYKIAGHSVASGMPLIPFLITGVLPFILFRDAVRGGIQAFRQNRILLNFPQISLFDLVTARALLELTTHFTAVILLILAIILVTGPLSIDNLLLSTVWFIASGVIGFGLGLTFGSLAVLFPIIEQLVPNLVLRPLFFLSGLFFTVEMLPTDVQRIALMNPLLHNTELLRSSFFIQFETSHGSPKFVILSIFVACCFGLTIQRALRKKHLTTPAA